MLPLKNYSLTTDPAVICQGPALFQTTELPGASPRLKQFFQITERLITYVSVQQSSTGFILHTTK